MFGLAWYWWIPIFYLAIGFILGLFGVVVMFIANLKPSKEEFDFDEFLPYSLLMLLGVTFLWGPGVWYAIREEISPSPHLGF